MTRLMRLPGKPRPSRPQGKRTARQVLDEAQSEGEFQSAVVDLAKQMGWLVFHDVDSRKNERGFPDWVFLKAGKLGELGRLVFAELKAEDGRVKPEQQEWLDGLATVPGITVRLWRPHDWIDVEAILRGDR